MYELNKEGFVLSRLAGNAIPQMFREGEFLHVSDLLHKCTRMIALSHRTGKTLTLDNIYDNQGIVHAIGHAVQAYVTNRVLQLSPDHLYGDWACLCGETAFKGTAAQARHQDACTQCRHPVTHYREFVQKHPELKITGSSDLTFLFEGAFYFAEAKSMKKEDWETLSRPLPDHILQVVFYWWLARELGLPVYREVSVFYVNKSYCRGSPYKEFTVNAADHVHRLTDYIEDARILLEAKAGGELPVRICPTISSPMAKRCELCTICFGVQ